MRRRAFTVEYRREDEAQPADEDECEVDLMTECRPEAVADGATARLKRDFESLQQIEQETGLQTHRKEK
jgi:hypothetical protein